MNSSELVNAICFKPESEGFPCLPPHRFFTCEIKIKDEKKKLTVFKRALTKKNSGWSSKDG